MTFTPRRYEQILADQIGRLVTRTDLSDVADSSSIKQVLAASSREDDELYFQQENILTLFSIDTATGEDLYQRAKEIQPGTLVRIGAQKSVGEVIFSRVGTSGTVNIPTGTRVKTTDNVVFITTATGTITAASPEQIPGHGVGRDSNPVPVVAEVAGSDGNVVAGSIIKFDNKPAGVDEVTNLVATTLGLDEESDDSFRQRIKDFVASLSSGTIVAYESGVLGLTDPITGAQILFSKAVEDILNPGFVTVYIDDGTGSAETTDSVTGENVTQGLTGPPPDSAVGGETQLFLDNKPVKSEIPIAVSSSIRGVLTENTEFFLEPATGKLIFDPPLVTSEVITADYTYFTGLIAIAQLYIDGDPNDRVNYPGVKAAGTFVRVLTPQVLIQVVTASLVVNEGYEQAEAVALAEQAVVDYINSLGISDDVIRNELSCRIQSLDAVRDLTLFAPTANVPILDDQMARITSANINIT